MSKDNNIVLTITSLSHLAVHAQMMVFPTLLLLFHHEFKLGMDVLGLMATTGAFMFGLGAIPAGLLERRIGGRNLLIIYQLGSALGGFLIILSTTPFQITLGLAVLGLSSSIYHPAGLTILSQRLNKLSKGLGIHGIAGSVGLAIGPLLAGITAEYFSWRLSYKIWIIFQLLLACLTFYLIKKSQNLKSSSFEKSKFRADKFSIFLYYIIAVAFGFSFGGFTTFMPSLFGMQQEGIFKIFPENLKAGIFTTLVFASGIVGQVIGGYLGDRYSRYWLIFIIVIVNIPFMLFIGYYNGWLLFIMSIFLGVVHFANQPISNALLADLTPSSQRGIGYGVSFFLSFGIGGIAPLIGGIITEKFSIEMVFPIMALSLIPGVFASWILIKRYDQTT